MNYHQTTRIPINDEYVSLVGKAVYVFAYYEWTIIYIIDYLEHGFVSDYSRGKPMTSGDVSKRLKETINRRNLILSVTEKDLKTCYTTFCNLVVKRNALIHSHPITDTDGSQILSYQTNQKKHISDMRWSFSEVIGLIYEIDNAAVEAGIILDKLRKKSN